LYLFFVWCPCIRFRQQAAVLCFFSRLTPNLQQREWCVLLIETANPASHFLGRMREREWVD
jgi:hypothetical protein